ncbi:REST corepressor isoform X1 [Drosophila erecta]|uniref:Uncharacterized protein, isoform E n=1 Tax=Drosophila erecta TaxID=7220 RepID=A0A0Q5T422_DROER|nr:REST corepressor isoform X1 [Drosophila erecta]XP_015011146.1 REST corepressor isoform X1 [Drosophila erecta]KQS30091.1 uncharacterized protein Dere_GG19230, isoform E [Drosophila erecta]KQS30092.1 uncharacterized protein Dere_GG19230, isoform G [Drosophila erecta]
MVLAERNTTDVVRNGRRSRGPSPNTHTTGGVTNSASLVGSGNNSGNSGNANANEKTTTAVPGAGTPESSDDDNSTKRNGKSKAKQSEYEEKIRVGRDYQAVCPPLVPEVERRPEQMNERALLVWSPTKEIPDLKLEEYISVAKEKYGYNGEQALGMLFWHKHDLERAVMDLANFTPFPDEWTIEDKVLFEQAFQFHGKSFHRIRQMLPDKSIASLVKYYYSWKKTRHRSSAMDRQEKTIKAVVKDGSENGSEVGSNEESDNDDKKHHGTNSTTNVTDATTTSTNNTTTTNSTSTSPANTTANTINSNQSSNNNSSGGGSGGNANNISNSNGEENNQGGGSNSSNTSNNDMDAEHLSLLAGNAQGDEMLGLGLSGDAAIGTNGSNNNGEMGGDPSQLRRVVVGGFCKICNVVCHVLHDSPLGRMCKSCHTHWRRTGNRRPISGPESNAPRRSTHNCAVAADRSKRKPPKGMYINHDDLTALASCKTPSVYLAERDRKISALMAEIQKNRQMMEQLDKECDSINVEDVVSKPAAANTEPAQPRISARWLPDEIQIALLAIREYGKNFPMIAKLVTTKTEGHVRTFYLNNRRRYNLDQIVKEYEAGKSEESGAEEQSEPVIDAAAAASATASAPSAADTASATSATADRKQSTETSNNGVEAIQEILPKKEDPKKPELGAAALKTVVAEAADTTPTAASSGSSSTVAGGTVAAISASKPSSSATITITDESDTATNSSSDVVTTGPAAATGSSSLSIASSAPAPKSQASSEELSAQKSNPASGIVATGAATGGSPTANTVSKRDGSAMAVAEQPPAKKIALSSSGGGGSGSGGAEFLTK